MRLTWDEDRLTERRLSVYPKIFLALYLALTIVWVALSTNLVDPSGQPLGYDFITFWAASDLTLAGRSIDVYDPIKIFAAEQKAVPANQMMFLWGYPPVYQLVALPLALLPYLWSYVVWVALTLTLYAAYFRRFVPSRHTLWLLLAFPAAFLNVMQGQNGFLIAVLIAAAGLNLERRPILAGVLIGVLSCKPHLGLLFPLVLLAGRHWVTFVAAGVTTLALAGLATLVFGVDNWIAFWNNLPLARQVLEEGNLPWHKMPTFFAAARMLGVGISAAHALHIVVAVIVAGLTVRVWYRRCSTLELRVALLSVALLLMSPYSFDYDLVVLAIPIALLAADGLRNGWAPGMRTMLVATWLAPLILPGIAEKLSIQLLPVMLIGLFACVHKHVSAVPDREPVAAAA